MAEAKEEKKESLSKEELQLLINLCSVANVQVTQAPAVINLINKMSKMIDKLS